MNTPTIKIASPRKMRAVFLLAALGAAAPCALANTEVWIGAHDVSATTNWSDNANWFNVEGTGTAGPNGNDVIFGDQGSGSQGIVNSVVDANLLNPNSLTFTNNSANGNFQTVLIPAGVTLINTNALTVGIRLSAASSYPTTVGIMGGGMIQNGSVLVDNSTTASGGGQLPWLDLSGLTNFFMTNNAGATLTVGGTSSGSEARSSGRVDLAQTNVITASAINVALGTGNVGLGGTLNLGAGTNTLNVGTFALAGGKINNATIKFLGATGGVRIRGTNGTDGDRNVTLNFGARTSSGTGQAVGTLDLTGGHPADIKATTATLGRSTSTDRGIGNIGFDTGTVDITTVNMGVSTSTGGATGNITNSGGFLIVSNMSMANQTGTTVAGAGNLYINTPGTVIVSNSIVKTTSAGVGSIVMTGGSLIVGVNIGAATNAIDNLTVADSSLTLPAGLAPSAYFTNITATGTANTINVTSVPGFFAYPAQFPLISYINALGDNNTFVVGTLPNSFKGYISIMSPRCRLTL